MTEQTPARRSAIRFIVCLGIVSLFADMTYEGAHSILGPFLQGLGATATEVGIIAGFGEMIAASLRFFSGKFADRTRAYWPIVFAGYGINILVVPALAFAGNWQAAALLVVAERTGKALRGPARDVLLSEATAEVGHGFGFGIHAAMDQTGAVVGPLIMAAIVAKEHRFGPAFLGLAIPAILTVFALIAARAVHPSKGKPPTPPAQQDLTKLFWWYVIAAGVLACGFADFALLSYHFQSRQLVSPALIPVYYAGAMGVVGATALLCGRLFDRYGIAVLCASVVISVVALPLGFLGGSGAVVASIVCWAIGLGAQDATLRSGIAQVVSMNKRGAAFGAFNAIYGVMWFAGSVLMGVLYDHSLVGLVIFGIVAQLAAAIMFFVLRRSLAAAAAA